MQQSLEVRGVSLDPPKTTNNPGESSPVQQQPLQQPLPRIQLPPQSQPLHQIRYQPNPNPCDVSLRQLDLFFIALQTQNAEAAARQPVVRHAVPESERSPSHAYDTVVPDRHQYMPHQSTQHQWEAPWSDPYMLLTPAP